MAPVLTMVFTPLFAVMLLVSAVVYATTGFGREFDREVLTVFDLLLVTVLGLVLYVVAQFAIGVWVSRQTTSDQDYILAGRTLGPTLVAFSVFATWFGAEAIVASTEVLLGNSPLRGARLCVFA